MSLNFALVISGDASGAKQAADQTATSVRNLGADAKQTSAAMTAANEQSVASAKRAMEALTGQAAAQRQLQVAVDAMIARGSPTDNASYRQRAADVAAYGDELDRLRARYNPLFAASKEYESELAGINRAHELGAINTREQAQAIELLNTRYTMTSVRLAGVGGRAQLTANQMLNLSRQGNDVVTMFALGISPMQIFASQVGQIYDALESGPQGLRGSLAAIGASLSAFWARILATFGAFPLMATGVVAGVGAITAGVLYLASTFDTTNKDAEEFAGWLEKIGKNASTTKEFIDQVAAAIKGMSIVELNQKIRQGQAEIAQERAKLSNPLDVITGTEGVLSDPAFVQTYQQIDAIIAKLKGDGYDTIEDLKRALGEVVSNRPDLQKYAEQWEELGISILKAKDAAEQAAKAADLAAHGMGAYVGRDGAQMQKWLDQNTESLRQIQRQQGLDLQGISARSPEERAALARAREAAKPITGDESAGVRNARIEAAGIVELTRANHDLAEAQRQRLQSLNDTIASAQLDVALVGKDAAETAALRMQHEQLAQVRAAAAAAGVSADENEIARIKQLSAEYGKLVALQSARQMIYDQGQELQRLQVERALVGTSVAYHDRVIAQMEAEQKMREAGIDGTSALAAQIRAGAAAAADMKTETDRLASAWDKVKSAGESALDSLVDGDWKGALDDLVKTALQLNVANPLKNWIFGGNNPTGADLGSNILGKLFGGADSAMSSIFGGSSVGAMSVNAGSVIVTGALGVGGGLGGLGDGITRLLSGANSNSVGGGDVASTVWNFFKGKGLADHQVAGIMGNIGAESSFNPAALNPTSGAYGLFQNLGSRLTGLGTGADLTQQLQYAWKELQTTEGAAFQKLLGSTDVRSATGAFAGFERAEGWSKANPENIALWDQRLQTAQQSLDRFGGVTSAATQNLGQFGTGLGQLGNALQQFPAAPSGGGGGLGGLLGSIFGGGGGLNSAFSGSSAYNWLSANPGGFIGLWDEGGYTGPGPKHKAAGIVHAGEIVWSQDDIARAGGIDVVEGMRLGRRGYVGGGAVEGGFQMPATGTSGGGQSGAASTASGGEKSSRVLVELSPDLKASILEESGHQTVQLIQKNDGYRHDLYNAGGDPR